MAFIFSIISNICFAFFGYYLGRYLDRKKKEKEEVKRNEAIRKHSDNLKRAFDGIDYSNIYGIVPLAHGVPAFLSENIYLHRVNEAFYYPIPEGETKKALAGKKYGFKQSGSIFRYLPEKNCLSPSFSRIMLDRINAGLALFDSDLDECKEELEAIGNEVANKFLSDLDEGKPRFNGAMFGVSFFSENRDHENDESPTVTMNFYTTDYFTFRVFAHYYLKHRDAFLHKHEQDIAKCINKLSIPFLSSFGVCCLLVVSFHDSDSPLMDDDWVLLGKRSDNVIVDKGLVHFTMNEAFSLRDTLQGGVPDFKECIERGLKEENGLIIDNMVGVRFGDFNFLDFCFDANKCEMGLSCYVKAVLDPEKNTAEGFRDNFFARYKTAQDGRLETTGFEMVKLAELGTYLSQNGDRMSNSLRYCLEMFKYRYDENMLR